MKSEQELIEKEWNRYVNFKTNLKLFKDHYNQVSPVKVETPWEAFEKYHNFMEEYQKYQTSGMTIDNKINPVCLKLLMKENKSFYAVYTNEEIDFFLNQNVLFWNLIVHWEVYIKKRVFDIFRDTFKDHPVDQIKEEFLNWYVDILFGKTD